ncbi:hypothetical protein TNCV_1147121 [Trichonephila clavipes]|nr:hypothetical protein TNCV_1147121 [Trichonephila clavipes]
MTTLKQLKGLLATDIVISNYAQVKRVAPELATPSPNFHTTPTGERLSHDIFNVHRLSLHGGSLMLLELPVWQLDTFDRGQIVGASFSFQNRQTAWIFKVDSVKSITKSRVNSFCPPSNQYMDGEQKTSDPANCKGQLTLTVRGEKLLKRIVRSQRS